MPPDEVFDAALKRFLAQRRVDMRSLAAELGIGRATLYRRAGGRDQVLGHVLWYLTDRNLDKAVRAAEGRRGADRIVAVIGHFLNAVQDQPAPVDPEERDGALHRAPGPRLPIQLRGVPAGRHDAAVAGVDRGRASSQVSDAVHQGTEPGSREQPGQQLGVHFLLLPQPGDLAVDEQVVHLLGDVDEGHDAVQDDERKPMLLGRPAQRRWDHREGAAQLEHQPGDASGSEVRHVLLELLVALPHQPETSGQQQLATLEQRADLVDLRRVHPADLTSSEVVTADDLGPALDQHGMGQDLGETEGHPHNVAP